MLRILYLSPRIVRQATASAVPLLSCLLLLPLSLATQAQTVDSARLCHLQARELALRVSEEMSGDFNAVQRQALTALSEETCLAYFAAPPGSADRRNSQTEDSGEAGQQVQEEKSGLFGDIRMIPPEDRVRRPGLKRR